MTAVFKALCSGLGADEVVFIAALLLITAGVWLFVGQASLIAPGVVLLYVALPSRQPFIVRAGVFQRTHQKEKLNC